MTPTIPSEPTPPSTTGHPETLAGRSKALSGWRSAWPAETATPTGQPDRSSDPTAPTSGHAIIGSGQPVALSGQPVALSGQPAQMAGQHGHLTDHTGPSTPQPSGQPSAPTGDPEHETSSPDTEAAAAPGHGGLFQSLAASPNLRVRRLEMLPLRGPDAVFSEPQGREPGEAAAPENLADLISSISVVGLVQPVLVEELIPDNPNDDPDVATPGKEADHRSAGNDQLCDVSGHRPDQSPAPGHMSALAGHSTGQGGHQGESAQGSGQQHEGRRAPRRLRLVSGERRLRAMRWGAVHDPDNDQFAALPAVVCPGPLTEAERRCWQLVENIAREDLQPGELAAALLLERCAIVEAKLHAAGRDVPDDVRVLEDPVQRWSALEKLRGTATDLAAPWSEVLHRLGLQLSQRRARRLVQAFAQLPREISAEMDDAKVRLHTRITFARLRAGRDQAADEIWAALRDHHRPDLLAAAAHAGLEHPDLSSTDAVDAAEQVHQQANAARAEKLSTPAEPPSLDPAAEHPTDATEPAHRETHAAPAAATSQAPQERPTEDEPGLGPNRIATVLDGLRHLTRALRAGRSLPSYDTGSLRLQLTELLRLLDNEPATPYARDPSHPR